MTTASSTTQELLIIRSITPYFEIASCDEQDNHAGTDGSGDPTYWKLKKTRNGCKGRTMKHPFNDSKKKIKGTSVFKPSSF